MKKTVAILLTLILCFALGVVATAEDPVAPVAITPDYTWYSADAIEYTIDSVEDLAGLAKLTQGDVVIDETTTLTKTDFANKTVKLTADLTFADNQYWYYKYNAGTVYDYCIKDFAGTFDGQNHIITGLKFNAPVNNSGLFSAVSGTVKNLTLNTVSANITSSINNFGFLAGNLTGTAEECHVNGATITASNTLNYTGALIGNANGASVDGCSATSVSAAWTGTAKNTFCFGGLIGYAKNSEIKNSSVTGVTFNCTTNTQYIGGFTGLTNSTTVTNCTATTVNITVDNKYNEAGGFVGRSEYSTYIGCNVYGFTVDGDIGESEIYGSGEVHGGFIGGFCGRAAYTNKFDTCSATGLTIEIEAIPGETGWAGGFLGCNTTNSTTCTVSNCKASGTITATGGGSDAYFGGFTGCSNNSLDASNCDVSGMTVNATDTKGNAGGFVGGLGGNSNLSVTITGCTAASSVTGSNVVGGICGRIVGTTWTATIADSTASVNVTSTNGVAGGIVGYIVEGANKVTIKDNTPSTNISGVIISEVANSPDKNYVLKSEGNVDVESYVCYGNINGYNVGFDSIQEAVDAGATTVTMLQKVDGDFIIENKPADTNFVLNLGEYTFNGTVHIHHKIASFTAQGSADGSNILLTAPLGEQDIFDGWCSGEGTQGGEPGDDAAYAEKTGDGVHWIAIPGVIYHTHFTHTDYKEIPVEDRHLDFGTITYGGTVPEALTVTFEYTGDAANPGIKGFEPNPYFTFSGIGSMTANIRPNGNLEVGTYNERIYVIMHDGSSHEIWVHLTVKETTVPSVPSAPSIPCDHKLDENGKCSRCGIIIISYEDGKPSVKEDDETNPSTGAESAVGIIAAVAAVSLAGTVMAKRK